MVVVAGSALQPVVAAGGALNSASATGGMVGPLSVTSGKVGPLNVAGSTVGPVGIARGTLEVVSVAGRSRVAGGALEPPGIEAKPLHELKLLHRECALRLRRATTREWGVEFWRDGGGIWGGERFGQRGMHGERGVADAAEGGGLVCRRLAGARCCGSATAHGRQAANRGLGSMAVGTPVQL